MSVVPAGPGSFQPFGTVDSPEAYRPADVALELVGEGYPDDATLARLTLTVDVGGYYGVGSVSIELTELDLVYMQARITKLIRERAAAERLFTAGRDA